MIDSTQISQSVKAMQYLRRSCYGHTRAATTISLSVLMRIGRPKKPVPAEITERVFFRYSIAIEILRPICQPGQDGQGKELALMRMAAEDQVHAAGSGLPDALGGRDPARWWVSRNLHSAICPPAARAPLPYPRFPPGRPSSTW